MELWNIFHASSLEIYGLRVTSREAKRERRGSRSNKASDVDHSPPDEDSDSLENLHTSGASQNSQ